jgi:hypothetical protein
MQNLPGSYSTQTLLLLNSEALTKTACLLASPLPTILEIGFPNLLGAKKLDFGFPLSECESSLPLSGPNVMGKRRLAHRHIKSSTQRQHLKQNQTHPNPSRNGFRSR